MTPVETIKSIDKFSQALIDNDRAMRDEINAQMDLEIYESRFKRWRLAGMLTMHFLDFWLGDRTMLKMNIVAKGLVVKLTEERSKSLQDEFADSILDRLRALAEGSQDNL